MPDATDPDPPNASSPNDPDWYVRQWEALCDELGTSDPNELLARVQTLKRQMERSGAETDSDEGLVTISEVEEVFRELNSKIAKLRERNAALAERLEADSDEDDNLGRLHRETEALFDTLGVTTIDEAQDRVQGLTDRIEELYQEKEQLVQAGFSTPADALDEIERLRAEREQLQNERDQLRQERDRLQAEQSSDASSSPGGPDTSALDAASALREHGIQSPAQVEALSRIVENLHDRIRDWVDEHGADTDEPPETVIGMLRRISNYLTDLPAPNALPAAAKEALGAATAEEAQTLADLIHTLAAQFSDALNVDRATLAEADARTLLLALNDTDLAPDDSAPSGDPASGTDGETASSGDALPAEAGDILGIQTVEDARELESLIDDMSDRLDQLREGHRKLDDAGLSPDSALSMIENMEAQLADLYHHSGAPSARSQSESSPEPSLDPALMERIEALLDAPTDAADDLSAVVRRLVDRLDALSDEHAVLAEADLTAPEAVERIRTLEAEREDAPDAPDATDAAQRLAAIDDVLGISSREEAEELSAIAHQMEEQLTMLYEEKQKLQELGLSSIEDAADMIESMEAQLDDLYEDKEALRDVEDDTTDQQSTFQQLEALYAERQKLQQALGVSDAEDVIEMVETLTSQLDDLYTGRDAEADPEERHDAQLWAPDTENDAAEEDTEPDRTGAPDATETTITLTSMEQQLEALYREKEELLEQGFGSVDEAVTRLQTQKRQIDVLQREIHTYRQRFDRLRAEFGTERVPLLVDLVHTLETKADTSIDELDRAPSSSDTDEYGVDIEAAAPLVPPDVLEQLDEQDDALSTLDVGAMRLNNDGTVAALNEQALQLPGLEDLSDRDAVVGRNFFHDLAPSTNNNLFFGRFQKGLNRGELDARFPYTFTSPTQDSQSFLVQLYRTPDSDNTWLFFRPS